jgi:hypothetical protein
MLHAGILQIRSFSQTAVGGVLVVREKFRVP